MGKISNTYNLVYTDTMEKRFLKYHLQHHDNMGKISLNISFTV